MKRRASFQARISPMSSMAGLLATRPPSKYVLSTLAKYVGAAELHRIARHTRVSASSPLPFHRLRNWRGSDSERLGSL